MCRAKSKLFAFDAAGLGPFGDFSFVKSVTNAILPSVEFKYFYLIKKRLGVVRGLEQGQSQNQFFCLSELYLGIFNCLVVSLLNVFGFI